MTTPNTSNESATEATTPAKDIGALSFSDYQRVRRGEAALESVLSAPAEKAEQEKPSKSDPEETKAKDEADETTEADDSEESDAKDESESDKPKRKSGYQRRVDRLNRDKAAARAEAEYWKEQALKGAGESKKDAPKVETAKADDASKPKPESYETHAEYVEALTDWKIEQRDKASKDADAKAKLEADHKELLTAHSKRVKAFTEKHGDFQEVIEELGTVPISPTFESLLISSENGPELLYALAKDMDEFERLAQLGPVAVARELGKFEAKLVKAEAAEKPEPKKLTNAPKPIAPVNAGGKGVVAKSIDDPNISFAEYERLRREQMKRRRG